MIAGLADVWPYMGELFEEGAAETALVTAGIAPDRATLRTIWDATMARVLREATLERPADVVQASGGRHGRHTPHLAPMLAEMQSLARAMPDARW
jgi:ring-1,2-phenylacetyl-CoA epoxidase subunit PaaC